MPAQGALGQILDRPLCRNTLAHVIFTFISVHLPCNLLEYESTVTYWQGSSVVSTLSRSPVKLRLTTRHEPRLTTLVMLDRSQSLSFYHRTGS